jgi:hypothetical protein
VTSCFELKEHGDDVERAACVAFLSNEFPQYAEFWQAFVVELTMRVHDVGNIGFRPQAELDAAGRPSWHVAVAQLHYTTLLHLVRAHDLLYRQRISNRDAFVEAITRLSAATDTAFELLGRCLIDGGKKDAWSEMAGKSIRQSWLDREKQPLELVRGYRNALLHGRVRPEWRVSLQGQNAPWATEILFYPSFETMESAVDWREVRPEDAQPADHLVGRAWTDVLDYLRRAWTGQLLPWARANGFAPPSVPEPVSRPVSSSPLSPAGTRAASAERTPEPTGGSISWPLPEQN